MLSVERAGEGSEPGTWHFDTKTKETLTGVPDVEKYSIISCNKYKIYRNVLVFDHFLVHFFTSCPKFCSMSFSSIVTMLFYCILAKILYISASVTDMFDKTDQNEMPQR